MAEGIGDVTSYFMARIDYNAGLIITPSYMA